MAFFSVFKFEIRSRKGNNIAILQNVRKVN